MSDTLIVAGAGQTGDCTTVPPDSAFGALIKGAITTYRPTSIIETGTYHGEGTTRIIASTLKELGLKCDFRTIECNKANYELAQANLKAAGLDAYVKLNLGVSLPQCLLPTKEKIKALTVDSDLKVFVDHPEESRVDTYYSETHAPDLEHDLLGKFIADVNYRPGMLLLDSAGHTGHAEFNYAIEMLEDLCIVALDDTNHIKHAKSAEQIAIDPRFALIGKTDEKYGSLVAIFTPQV